MNKQYLITFSVSVIVLFSIAAVLLMVTLPEQIGVLEGNAEDYEAISRPQYTYKSTKNITTDVLEKDYIVTGEQMNDYENKYLYLPGNSDPFSPKIDNIEVESDSSDGNNTNGSSNGSSSTNDPEQTAKDKTTNSNGGVENPPSTNK